LEIIGSFARAFGITSKGDIYIRDIRYMTGTEAHLVVVAQDSGVPPCCASVPVVVKLAREIALSRNIQGESPNILMLVILSLVLAAFLLIIVSLSVYICKSKKHPSPIPSDHSSLDPLSMQHPYPTHNGPSSLTYSLNPLTHSYNPHKSPITRPLSVSSDRSEVTTVSTVSMAQPFLQSSKTVHNQNNQSSQMKRQIKPQNKVAPLKPSPSMNECGLPSNPNNETTAKQYENVIHSQIMTRNNN
jgi:hypothetical protein